MKNDLGGGDIVHNEQLFNVGISGYGHRLKTIYYLKIVYKLKN